MAAAKRNGRGAAKRGGARGKTVSQRSAAQTTTARASAPAKRGRPAKESASETKRTARTQAAMRRAARPIDEAIDAVVPVATGMEQVVRSWMGFFQRAAISQHRLLQEILSLRPSSDALRAQLAFVGENLRNLAESSGEVFQASSRLAERAQRAEQVGRRSAERLGQAYRDHAEAQIGDLHRAAGNGFGGGRGEPGRRLDLS